LIDQLMCDHFCSRLLYRYTNQISQVPYAELQRHWETMGTAQFN